MEVGIAFHGAGELSMAEGAPTEVSIQIRMAPGKVFGLKNGEPVMADVH